MGQIEPYLDEHTTSLKTPPVALQTRKRKARNHYRPEAGFKAAVNCLVRDAGNDTSQLAALQCFSAVVFKVGFLLALQDVGFSHLRFVVGKFAVDG